LSQVCGFRAAKSRVKIAQTGYHKLLLALLSKQGDRYKPLLQADWWRMFSWGGNYLFIRIQQTSYTFLDFLSSRNHG